MTFRSRLRFIDLPRYRVGEVVWRRRFGVDFNRCDDSAGRRRDCRVERGETVTTAGKATVADTAINIRYIAARADKEQEERRGTRRDGTSV